MFRFGRGRSPIQFPGVSTIASSWLVTYGEAAGKVGSATWQDEQFAVTLAADQPEVWSPSGRFLVVGDLWFSNRQALLQRVGLGPAQWQNDRQLLAHLWDRWGADCVTDLVGMFALVVWDREQQVLWLGRDLVGSRTLYYTQTGATRWIAPRLHPLAPYHNQTLDLVALRDYLCCAFVPGERTLWQQVRELRPGCLLQFPQETINSYWELQEQITGAEQSLDWHGDRLRELLEQVMQEYLPPGEPVGAFLSGGLDSSCITALAARFHDAPVHTYSIHFGKDCPNELEFSSLVAHHCQTQHHVLEITPAQMWDCLPETMALLDDPIGDPLTVPNLLLGRLAHQSVQVIVNGEGGDPCFGGPKNQPMLINSLYGSLNQQDAIQAYLISFQKCALDLPRLLQPEVWTAVQSEPSVFAEDLLNSEISYLNRLMTLNIKFKGADQILTKVNNLTQAAGLQGRSPLFDPRVVDLSLQVPPEYKLSGVEEKAVLKRAVADLLPPAIIQRPKSGMMVPVQLGFRKFWQRQSRRLLLDRKAAIAAFLDRSLIQDWLNYQGDTWNRYGVKLWLLVSLELWLQAATRR